LSVQVGLKNPVGKPGILNALSCCCIKGGNRVELFLVPFLCGRFENSREFEGPEEFPRFKDLSLVRAAKSLFGGLNYFREPKSFLRGGGKTLIVISLTPLG